MHIEQCLLAAVQSRIQKRRYSKGMPPSDDASDQAYVGLYEGTEHELWQIFKDENSERLSHLIDESDDGIRSIALDEEFTYWLFKRRIENTNAPQVAAETQRGLDMMARINDADERRARLLKDQNGGALLEFGLVKRRNGKPHYPVTKSRLNPEVFNAWLVEQPKENRQLIADIRDAIIASGHNFMEGIKWGTPGYWLPEVSRRNIVYIAPHNNYVRLGFFNGATMPDPDNLLEGTGKKTPPHQNPRN